MTEDKIEQIFDKVETKMQVTFISLPSYDLFALAKSMQQMQEASWFLEKLSPKKFLTTVKGVHEKLETSLAPLRPILEEIVDMEAEDNLLKFKYKHKSYAVPLVNVSDLYAFIDGDRKYFKGYYIQLTYLMRPENYLSLCLFKAHQEGSLCRV